MSRTRKFLGGVAVGYFSQLVMTVSGFVLTPVILHAVGQQAYGLWAVGLQITLYFGLLDLGVVALLPREVAYATGRGESEEARRDELRAIVARAGRVVLWQLPAVALAALATWLFMPVEWEPLRGPLALILVVYVVLFPLRLGTAILQGIQDLAFASMAQTIAWMIGTGAMVALVLAGAGLSALAVGWVVNQLLVSIACLVRLRNQLRGALPRRLPRMSTREVWDYIRKTSFVSISQVAQALVSGSDVLIIGKVLGPAAVVPYVMTGKLITLLANQPYMVLHVALPGLAELRAGSSPQRLQNAATALGQAMLMLTGLVLVLVMMVNRSFVAWWVGPEQFAGLELTGLICVLAMLRSWNAAVSVLCFALGEEKRLAYTSLADGVVTFGASIALVWLIGPIGAPIGGIMGVALVSLPFNVRAGARQLEISTWSLVSPLVPIFVRTVVVAVLAGLLASHWPPPTFLGLATASIAATLAYVLVAGSLVFRAPLEIYVRPRLGTLTARLRVLGHRGSSA